MNILIFSALAIAFWFFAPTSLSPSSGAEAGQSYYTPGRCAKINQRNRVLKVGIRVHRGAVDKLRSRNKKTDAGLNKIQRDRRRLRCTNSSRSDIKRSTIKKCSRLTKNRMRLLRQKASADREYQKMIKKWHKAIREWDKNQNRVFQCNEARIRRETERARWREPPPRYRQPPPRYDPGPRYEPGISPGVAAGIAAAIGGIYVGRRSGGIFRPRGRSGSGHSHCGRRDC